MGGKRRGSKDVKDSEERGDWREEKGIKDARDSAGKRWEVRSRSKHERVGLERRDGRLEASMRELDWKEKGGRTKREARGPWKRENRNESIHRWSREKGVERKGG